MTDKVKSIYKKKNETYVMIDIQNIQQEGIELLEQSVCKFKQGKIQEGEALRCQASSKFDAIAQHMNEEAKRNDALYGPNRNFGVIYNVFENNLKNLSQTEAGKRVIVEATKMIQSDPNLKGQFDVMQTIDNVSSTKHPDLYVEAAMKLMPKDANLESIVESNERLLKAILKSGVIDEMVEISDKQMACYEAMECLLTTPYTAENIDKITEAKDVIVEHISNISLKNDEHAKKTLDALSEEFASRADLPSKEDFELFRKISLSENPRTMFEELRREVLEMIEDEMAYCNEDEMSEWATLKEEIEKTRYNRRNPYECIAKLTEIKSIVDSDVLNG